MRALLKCRAGASSGSDSAQGRVTERRQLETTFSKKVSTRLLEKVGVTRKTGAFGVLDYLKMGIAFEQKKQFEKALDQYKKALSIDPKNKRANARLQAVLLLAIE